MRYGDRKQRATVLGKGGKLEYIHRKYLKSSSRLEMYIIQMVDDAYTYAKTKVLLIPWMMSAARRLVYSYQNSAV